MYNSGILTLYALHQQDLASPLHQQAISAADDAADLALKVAEKYLKTDIPDFTNGDVPPFILPWMYKAGMRFLQTAEVKKLSVVESALHKLDTKWKAAGKCANAIYIAISVANIFSKGVT